MTASEKSNNKSPRRNKWALIVAFLVILLIINTVKIILDSREKKELKVYYETELTEARERLDEISAELDEKIVEIARLGGDITELEQAKADLEQEKARLERTRTANRELITNLRDKVEGYEELLIAKDKEIERLEDLNEVLLTENTELKTEANELNQNIRSLEENKKDLEEKVEVASRLKAESIGVFAINKRGKERTSPFRKKQISKLKVEFDVIENEVAPIEGKDMLIRIVSNNGQVLFDVARGSGTFMLDGREEFYTANKEILYDRTRQKVTILYDKGSEYESGEYKLEIYTDGYMLGAFNFVVR